MRKGTKIWLITAACLVTVGAIMFTAVMTAYHWDFSKLTTEKYETKTFEIKEDFSNISVDTDTADVAFSVSEDGICRAVCYGQAKTEYSVSVTDGTLTLNSTDGREWYEYIGINQDTQKITVYLPKSEYGSLSVKGSTGNIEMPKDFAFESTEISVSTGDIRFSPAKCGSAEIKTSTGDIKVAGTSADTLALTSSTGTISVSDSVSLEDIKIRVSTGDAKITDTNCSNFISSGSTGSIVLKNFIAKEKLSVKRSTGDVKFDGSDASEIFVETNTGEVTGTLLSEKVFITETSSGDINVPKTVTGGKCEITTSTGDIRIKTKE